MTTSSFVPEYWSAKLQTALSKALVFGSPSVVNHDYEGEIANAGDTVKINAIGDPTVSTYSPNSTTLSYEQLNTASQNLVVDQAKSFAFQVDDVDKRQALGGAVPKATRRAAYKIADIVDQYIEALFAGVNSANALGTIAVTTSAPNDAYDKILIPLKVTLDNGNVPTDGRFVVLPPWMEGRLLRDDRFVRADASGQGANGGVQGNGSIGRAAGFDVKISNNCANVTGDDYRCSAGVSDAITVADQINEVEALRLQSSFSDAVRGLYLYGAKLVRPELIATAIASQT